MYCWFLILLILNIFGVSTATSAGNSSHAKKLANLEQQLNRIELQLNNSFNQLLEKLDANNKKILDSIKSIRYSQLKQNGSSNRPIAALLIIDVQNDFINGTLSLRNCPSKHNGEEVVPVINQLLDKINFDVIVYSHDWHPADHISFFDNLPRRAKLLAPNSTPIEQLHVFSTATFIINNLTRMEQTLWPRHCVQHSFGAQLHPDLKVLNNTNPKKSTVIHTYKGTKPNIDSYSAFWDNFKLSETDLHKQLQAHNVTHVFLTGIATDICVYSTGIDALEYGYETFLIEDACRGVDEKNIKSNLQTFKNKNGHVIQSNEVKNYIQ